MFDVPTCLLFLHLYVLSAPAHRQLAAGCRTKGSTSCASSTQVPGKNGCWGLFSGGRSASFVFTQRSDILQIEALLAGIAHTMALSANMAGAGAGGAGMAMTGGMAFQGNAVGTPATFSSSFRPPPSGHGGPGDTCCGGGGGGAYDLRALEREEEPQEDLHACLGVDVGTSSIKVRPVLSRTDLRLYSA